MKKVLAFVLALVLALSLFGCEQNSTTSSENSAVISPDEITTDTIAFLGVLNNTTWESGDDISTYMYYAFYRDYINSITTPEERQRLYIRPEYENGFSYPKDEFEAYVQKYFDVSVKHLRESDCYVESENFYTIQGGGGSNIKYRVRFPETDAIKIDGDTAFVKAELSLMGDFSDTECRLYTLKKVNGGFKYISSKITQPSYNSTILSENSVISPDEITTDTISFLGVLNNTTWESGEDIDTLSYLLWYRDFTNASMDLDQMQNFVFNADDFEECVQKYFDVSAQHLRKCEYYDSKENVYTFLVNGKYKYRVNLSKENAVQIQGDTAFVKAELPLTGDFSSTEHKLYTLKKVGDNFKYISSESIMPSEVSIALQDVEHILSDFGEDMLLNYPFENPKEIPDFDLITWYGYRLKSQGKTITIPDGYDRAVFPKEEFESAVYNYFGIESDVLRKSQYYTKKYNGYILDTALMGRPQHFYEITNVEVENNIYKISFLLRIANNDPYACVLTAKKTDNGFRFISYINEKPELKF